MTSVVPSGILLDLWYSCILFMIWISTRRMNQKYHSSLALPLPTMMHVARTTHYFDNLSRHRISGGRSALGHEAPRTSNLGSDCSIVANNNFAGLPLSIPVAGADIEELTGKARVCLSMLNTS